MSEHLIAERRDGVLRLTLNRPEKLNALTGEMLDALRREVEAAGRDDTRVVLLTGAGKAFCVGQDLEEPNVAPGSDLGAWLQSRYNPLVRALCDLPKPVLARVNGVAAGAGANLAFACDLVIAAKSARFIESFARIGLLPDSGGTWMLPRLVGHARAVAIAMVAEPFGAEDACAWGAIWKAVDDSDLGAKCESTIDALRRAPTKALAAVKLAMRSAWSADLREQLERERDFQRALGKTDDFREGIDAFSRKREPSFKGS